MEFQRNNPAKAAEVFRALARSPDPGVRAGALLRLGRNLRKTGRNEEALEAYNELAQLGRDSRHGTARGTGGARSAMSVLEAIGKREQLRKEA